MPDAVHRIHYLLGLDNGEAFHDIRHHSPHGLRTLWRAWAEYGARMAAAIDLHGAAHDRAMPRLGEFRASGGQQG